MGKPLAIGLKYGLFKPGAYVAGMGLRAADCCSKTIIFCII